MNYDLGPSVQHLLDRAVEFIPNLIVAIIIFVATLFVAQLGAGMVRKALQRRRSNPEVTLLLARLAQWTILSFGVIWALAQVKFDVTGFVAGLGIAGFTVGFALKDIAENFVAGILLLIQQPFSIGDSVQVKDYGGTVADIQIRSTTILTWDGLLVIIPNAAVYSNPITNYSKINKRRITVTLGVDYKSDLPQVEDTLRAVVAGLAGLNQEPAPLVVFNELGDPALKVTLYFWIDLGKTDYLTALDAAVKGIKVAFEQEGIHIPSTVQPIYVQHRPELQLRADS